jgi:hypothetical protein
MSIVRIFTGPDQQSHFEDVELRLQPQGDQSETGELLPGSGILVRRFAAGRSNPWHHAPGRYAVFTANPQRRGMLAPGARDDHRR